MQVRLILLLTFVLLAPSGLAAHQYKLKTIYSFCSKSSCSDGARPEAALIADGSGNFFGTTANGGDDQRGTIFELTQGAGAQWIEKVLYRFHCVATNCPHGQYPGAPLIADTAGNLYGTTYMGGRGGGGVVFELSPNTDRSKWKFKALYEFCPGAMSCADGVYPNGSLTYAGASSGIPYDGTSPLYGTTGFGGGNGAGEVFSLTPKGAQWTERVIYSFCAPPSCQDGEEPFAGVIADGSGNLFGTTAGGAQGGGAVYELKAGSNGKTWRETTLYDFCQDSNCTDGKNPDADLHMDASGNLFGTTTSGGSFNSSCDAIDCGVAFKIARHGGSARQTVLYRFCMETSCTDGANPGTAGLTIDPSKTVFGTTSYGGSHADQSGLSAGTVFSISKAGSYNVLHSFCAESNCTDGEYPTGGLVEDNLGNIFGVTNLGGTHGYGTVFELVASDEDPGSK